TVVSALNDAGQTAGTYVDASGPHGFVRDADGTLTSFDFPGSTQINVSALNDAGQVVGHYFGALVSHGFRPDAHRHIATFDVPGSTQTIVSALNDAGQAAGYYVDADGHQHGFVATPVHPAVSSVVVNDGAAQRSMVTSLTVTFNTVVTLDPDAFEMQRQGH